MKRYHVNDGGWPKEADDGEWADYDEACDIEQERDALRAELAALKEPAKPIPIEEVIEPGIYAMYHEDGRHCSWVVCLFNSDGKMFCRFVLEDVAITKSRLRGKKFIGPIKASEGS